MPIWDTPTPSAGRTEHLSRRPGLDLRLEALMIRCRGFSRPVALCRASGGIERFGPLARRRVIASSGAPEPRREPTGARLTANARSQHPSLRLTSQLEPLDMTDEKGRLPKGWRGCNAVRLATTSARRGPPEGLLCRSARISLDACEVSARAAGSGCRDALVAPKNAEVRGPGCRGRRRTLRQDRFGILVQRKPRQVVWLK